MAFVLQDVINEIEETRSLEPLKKFKKENLAKVAAHYGITPAIGATKSHILDLIKDHCVENDIINEVECCARFPHLWFGGDLYPRSLGASHTTNL